MQLRDGKTVPNQLAFIDRSADRKYFTIIPNVVWTLGLSTVAFRLYATIKKVAGENGTCFMGTRRLAQEAGISAGSVSAAKQELEVAGLISIIRRKRSRNGQPLDHVEVTDIWAQNMAHFVKRSADEHGCSGDERRCSGDETEEEHEEEQGRNDVDESQKQSFDALSVFNVDAAVARKLAGLRGAEQILGWINYAKAARGLQDPPAFVVRRLLDNEVAPGPSERSRDRQNGVVSVVCHKCWRVVYVERMCPGCGCCSLCCECQEPREEV